jgi:hypothetical protein
LANAAKYLTRLGQKVVALDLDLEAPGLNYKLVLDDPSTATPIEHGIVDCIHYFKENRRFPESLSTYAVGVRSTGPGDKGITLIPAGNIRSAEYWRRLAQIDWHSFFFTKDGLGVPFFLELKARIESEFSPDFLLIDARTGITEIGGVASTVIPDKVVCLLLLNRENLDGSREVLRGITAAPRLPGQSALEILTVISRIPSPRRRMPPAQDETTIIGKVKSFLLEDASDALKAAINETVVLHSEDSLQLEEALRIGGDRTVEESPLLRDYLRLFARLIPRSSVEPHLEKLIQGIMARMVDAPDITQNELEALADYCPHPASYLALLKYYRLRNAGPARILRVAAQYWELTRDSSNPLLWEAVSSHFSAVDTDGPRGRPVSLDFVEAVWDAFGSSDGTVALRLADAYYRMREPDKANDVLRRLVSNAGSDPGVIVACINKFAESGQSKLVASLIEQHRPALSANPDFQAAWANVVVRQGSAEEAKRLFESQEFRPASLQAASPTLYAHLLRLAGQTDELNAALRNMVEAALASRDDARIYEAAQSAFELGRWDFFVERVRKLLPPTRAERVLAMLPFSKESSPGWRHSPVS